MSPTPDGMLAALANDDGYFTILAADQRESLRTIMARGGPPMSVEDRRMREFKQQLIDVLAPQASAVLLDRQFGIAEAPVRLPEGCALILAADVLHQRPGHLVAETSLDPAVTVDYVHEVGAAALKLLVIWRGVDHERGRRADLVGRFLELCNHAGVGSIVEGVVRGADNTELDAAARTEAIFGAAAELGAVGADLYKAEVPRPRNGDWSAVAEDAKQITAAVCGPWVVLSSGIAPDVFPTAVTAACRGGARGFLAGRAIWSQAAATEDPGSALQTSAVANFARLVDSVRQAM